MRIGLLLLAFAAMTSSAIAQEVEQTTENAQRFLTLIGESRDIRYNLSRTGWPNWSAEYKAQFARMSECETQVNGTPFAFYDGSWRYRDSTNFDTRFAAQIARYKPIVPPFKIPWAKVSSVTIVGGLTADSSDYPGQVVLITTKNATVQFWISDTATAKRVQYAMEFLRVACDETAETGF
jgi:hypothetical protein